MRIRWADLLDIPELVYWGEKFWDFTWFKQELNKPYSPESVEALCRHLIQDMSGFILVVADDEDKVRGFVLVTIAPFIYSMNDTIAGELAWYVDPELRGGKIGLQLLAKAELIATMRGVTYMTMISMAHSMDIGPLYEKMGYSPTETTYVKEL